MSNHKIMKKSRIEELLNEKGEYRLISAFQFINKKYIKTIDDRKIVYFQILEDDLIQVENENLLKFFKELDNPQDDKTVV